MSESKSNSSVVAIVGIVAIILIVAIALYFFLIANGGDADIEIDLPGASSVPAMLDFAHAPDTVPMDVWFPA